LTFWRKKQRQDKTDASSTGSPEVGRTVEESDAARSREILKVLTLEREILGTALTTIYESEVNKIITREERDRLIDKYSGDLKELESKISEHQRIVDTFDLQSAREELVQSFQQKLQEIDKKLSQLALGAPPEPLRPAVSERKQAATADDTAEQAEQSTVGETSSEPRDPKTKAEKKMVAIREEVLKAMERLEEIESEG
jgi:hypothetical protein